MNLFILRHGHTVNAELGTKDIDRKLSEKGILQAVKIGDYLKSKKIDQIICSSATRAVETQAIINEFLKIDDVIFVDELYLASYDTILKNINKLAKANNVLFVGHNFGITDLASNLTANPINMSTCMLVQVKLEVGNWNLLSAQTTTLVKITEPNQL